jgi:hypothetical protein
MMEIKDFTVKNFGLHEWRADKSLARPGRKQATVTKLGIRSTYSPWSAIHLLSRCSNFWNPLKNKIHEMVRPTRSPPQQWPPRRTKNGDPSIVQITFKLRTDNRMPRHKTKVMRTSSKLAIQYSTVTWICDIKKEVWTRVDQIYRLYHNDQALDSNPKLRMKDVIATPHGSTHNQSRSLHYATSVRTSCWRPSSSSSSSSILFFLLVLIIYRYTSLYLTNKKTELHIIYW